MSWSTGTRILREALEASREPAAIARYDARELGGLPPPVQRFFRAVLTDGQPVVTAVSVEQAGTIDMGTSKPRWKPFTAQQRIVTRRPGFDWDARIMMLPGVPVRIHDAYVAGVGTLHGELFGLVPVVDLTHSAELARGELMRYFAEAAWYPTALLPSQGVRWEAVDENSALATLTDGPVSLALTFRFRPDGPIDTVQAASRARMVDGQLSSAPWQGRFRDDANRGGMQVPLQGEVAWILPEGVKPYWRGTATSLTYEFAP
ncbi:MAG: hypothetical protein K0S48_3487 [Ramlibacter sp.]|jgi:hypothetical protein|nr:hypothetical protein [Ramlibacter sp.]